MTQNEFLALWLRHAAVMSPEDKFENLQSFAAECRFDLLRLSQDAPSEDAAIADAGNPNG